MSVHISSWVWRHADVTEASDLIVLLALADWADDDGFSYPKRDKIIARCKVIGEQTVRRALRRLEAAGLIETRVGLGRGNYSGYRVITSPEQKGSQIPLFQNLKGSTSTAKRVPPVPSTNNVAHAEPSLTPSESLPHPTPPVPAPPSRPAPVAAIKPNKSGELIDTLKAAGVPLEMTPRDHAALKRSSLTPTQVAESYCAAYRGEWGDDWLRANLAVHTIISRWAGYQSSLTPTAPRAKPREIRSVTDLVASKLRQMGATHRAEETGPTQLSAFSTGVGGARRQLPPASSE